MRGLAFLLLALFGLSMGDKPVGDDIDFDKYKKEIETALKKLVEIVEENEMNVTFIMSQIDRWSTDEVKEVEEHSICLPTYNVQKTESKITEENVQDWIKAIKDLSTESKIIGRSRTATIKDGKTDEVKTTPTPDDNTFDTRLYKTVTSVNYGKQGFAVDTPSYQEFYNIYVPGTDGKDERIEIVTGYVETEVVKKSESMSDDEVKEIEHKMKEIFMKHDCRKVMGRILKDYMNNKFENNDWQIIMDPGDEFYVPAKKYALVRAASSNALVYSM